MTNVTPLPVRRRSRPTNAAERPNDYGFARQSRQPLRSTSDQPAPHSDPTPAQLGAVASANLRLMFTLNENYAVVTVQGKVAIMHEYVHPMTDNHEIELMSRADFRMEPRQHSAVRKAMRSSIKSQLGEQRSTRPSRSWRRRPARESWAM